MTSRAAKDGSYTWTYIYDARNCLVEAKKDSVVIAQYYYDDFGNRIKAAYPRDAEIIAFDFDLTGLITENPITERYSDGRIQNYIYLNRKLLARVDGDIADVASKKYWYLTDQLGSTRGLTDKDGHLVWSANYEAFGSASVGIGTVSEVPRSTGKAYYSPLVPANGSIGRRGGRRATRASQ